MSIERILPPEQGSTTHEYTERLHEHGQGSGDAFTNADGNGEEVLITPGGKLAEYPQRYRAPDTAGSQEPNASPMEQPRLTIDNFDEKRIDWEWGTRQGVSERLGLDPKLPGFVVRKCLLINPSDSLKENARHLEAVREASITEMQRLVSGTGIIVPDYFFVTPPQEPEETSQLTYLYTQRLIGERPDLQNPAHTQHLLAIGEASTAYLEKTPVDGRFSSEHITLKQYTIGRPAYHPAQQQNAYLHDVETVEEMDTRPGLATAPEERAVSMYARGVAMTRHWVHHLPGSHMRDNLLGRLETLWASLALEDGR